MVGLVIFGSVKTGMQFSSLDRIYSQKVHQIYNQGISAIFGVTGVSLVSVFLFWNPQLSRNLIIWFCGLLALSLIRLLLLRAYKHAKQPSQHPDIWARRYLQLELLMGLAWASLGLVLYTATEIDHVLMMLILGSMATGALPMLSMVLSIYSAYLFSLGLSTVLILFTKDDPYSLYLALFSLLFITILWLSARTNYHRHTKNLSLSQENLDLIESLQLTNKQLLRQVNETQGAERNAREAEGRFRTLANATSEGVVLYENGRIVDCNENLTRMLGYTREELFEKNIEQLFTRNDGILVLELLSHNDGIPYELHCEDKYGITFPVELVKRRLPLEGRRSLYVFALRDISELKHMSEIKDQFISTVSHELRTPITSIHASLGLVLGGVVGEVPEKFQQLINIAHQNSERLNLLINDLLDIQKLDIGKLHFNFEILNVIELLQQCVELNAGYFDKHKITVQLDETNKDINIRVDRDRFIQVITNLLSNAAKFSPLDSEVKIYLNLQGDLIQIHIHDQGTGIPEEFKEKIFQRFTQADASNTRVHGGSGLGLYISKQIMHEMKGDIDFQSETNKGTTFTITLPTVKTDKASTN